MTSISAIASSAISVLFSSPTAQATDVTPASQTQPVAATGHTDDAMKTGGAIGKIIEIVSGMSQSDKLFDMKNAQRAYAADGEYSETLTGTGTVATEAEMMKSAIAQATEAASGTGPQADRGKAFLAAAASGGIQKTDMATMGVTSTMTETDYYYADGRQKGGSGSWNTQGMDQFLEKNVTIKDGIMYNKAGDYASISQNGTEFIFNVWPKGSSSNALPRPTSA
ncbi:hypothetical protein [Rhizobium sp. L245/93]|uniref:hypothetical protein n=1 Tax=Rhizobium sp. L245/93 TaxID=2819998 RepID=UPI001ADB2F4D|nr:hypothetical protein [Rhizobium sp. L245/93]MBO9169960.1 hypothetical protein [Rhizobium sp. L245/93]